MIGLVPGQFFILAVFPMVVTAIYLRLLWTYLPGYGARLMTAITAAIAGAEMLFGTGPIWVNVFAAELFYTIIVLQVWVALPSIMKRVLPKPKSREQQDA